MRVTNDRAVAGPTRARRADGARSGGAFRALLADDPAPAQAQVSQAHATAALDAVLLAQQADPDALGRDQAARHGGALLDHLDDIRLGLLAGAIPRERLLGLTALVRAQRAEAPEPRLASVLAEIELRAQVELAKLGMAVSGAR